MNKETWKYIIQTIIAILTAILTTLGVTSCMGTIWTTSPLPFSAREGSPPAKKAATSSRRNSDLLHSRPEQRDSHTLINLKTLKLFLSSWWTLRGWTCCWALDGRYEVEPIADGRIGSSLRHSPSWAAWCGRCAPAERLCIHWCGRCGRCGLSTKTLRTVRYLTPLFSFVEEFISN